MKTYSLSQLRKARLCDLPRNFSVRQQSSDTEEDCIYLFGSFLVSVEVIFGGTYKITGESSDGNVIADFEVKMNDSFRTMLSKSWHVSKPGRKRNRLLPVLLAVRGG